MEEKFDNFFDLVRTFPLYRGKGTQDATDPEDRVIGKFKGAIKVYPNGKAAFETKIQPKIPSNKPVPVVVRVYIIKVSSLLSYLLIMYSSAFLFFFVFVFVFSAYLFTL